MDIMSELYRRIEKDGLWEKEIFLKRNEYLCEGGSVETNLYYIVSGSVKVFILDDFEERIVRFGYKNNFVAAMDSFISQKPSDFYIQAIKETKLKMISRSRYLEFINKNPENRLFWNQILEQLILQQLEREKDILTTSPLQRYQRVLKRSPQLFQEIPNKHIASYLRMTPETLSRLKKIDFNQANLK